MSERDWVSAHAFYHGDQDHLLTGAVAPVVDELTKNGAVDDWFFLRYWERGPHLRLRLIAQRDRHTEVQRCVRDRLEQCFRDHPSADRMRNEQYATMAHAFARTEQLETYATTLHPNNTLSFIPYHREHHRYGNGASAEAVERHFGESSRIAMRMVTLDTSPKQRATTAFASMLLTWMAWEPEPGKLSEVVATTPSDSSGAKDMLGIGGRSGAASAHKQHGRAVEIARRMRRLAAVADTTTRSGTLVDWFRSMSTLRDSLRDAVQAGSYTPPILGYWGRQRRPYNATDVDVLPTMEICTHLLCNRLGLPLDTEQALRKSATDALGALVAEESTDGRGT